jgi:hypothetical protein
MTFWETRTKSVAGIASTLGREAQLIEDLLSLLAVCAEKLEAVPQGQRLSRAAAICTIKARNLGLASYSLSLDALAQEAGALVRPLIETMELLAYLRADPSRVHEVLENRLPSAGERGKAINGKFKKWRDYLNAHASHFGLTPDSVRHLFDINNLRLRIVQPYDEAVLRENLKSLFAVLYFCATEAVLTLDLCAPGFAEGEAETLVW